VKKSDEIKQKIADATDRAEAIVNLAKDKDGNDRPLSVDEQKSWKSIMDEKDGELAKLNAELKSAIAYEGEVARLRAARQTTETPTPVYGQSGKPAGADGASALPANVRVVNPTLRAFTWAKDKDQNLRNAYDCGLWFKALVKRDQPSIDRLAARRGDWLATLNESNPQDGGTLVVPEFERSVITYREMVGVVRKLARIVQMGSDSYTFYKQSGGTTVYYPGEEGTITASDFDFAAVSLQAKKRAILAYVSTELNDDAIVSVMDLLAADIGHQFALQEDNEGIKGDGTSTYGGVLGLRPAAIAATAGTATAATGHDTWPELDYSDIASAIAKLSDKYQSMPISWLCSAAFKWQVFDRLAYAQSGASAEVLVNGVPVAAFAGRPIYVCDRMPTTAAASTVCALAGSFENCLVLGERAGIRIATSEHVAFTTDQIAVRGTTRYDIKVHEQGDTSTAGALVSLKTAA
jgi:HK97 family phage major capsid protein